MVIRISSIRNGRKINVEAENGRTRNNACHGHKVGGLPALPNSLEGSAANGIFEKLGKLWKRRKLPQRVPGQSPIRKRIWNLLAFDLGMWYASSS